MTRISHLPFHAPKRRFEGTRPVMNYSWKKILSGTIAIATCMTWAFLVGDFYAFVPPAIFDAVALILIWNSDDLGSSTLTGFMTSPTP